MVINSLLDPLLAMVLEVWPAYFLEALQGEADPASLTSLGPLRAQPGVSMRLSSPATNQRVGSCDRVSAATTGSPHRDNNLLIARCRAHLSGTIPHFPVYTHLRKTLLSLSASLLSGPCTQPAHPPPALTLVTSSRNPSHSFEMGAFPGLRLSSLEPSFTPSPREPVQTQADGPSPST